MALAATFRADFSSFLNAVQQADIKLADFGKGADTVEKKLNKMVDNFSGRAVIQEATLMGAAIQKIGGFSQLSANDLEKVSQKANEAAATMKRLGIEGAGAMQQFAADATKASQSVAEVGTQAKNTGSVLSGLEQQLLGVFSIGSVIAFGKEVLDAGDRIQKMADQTGLSTAEVQKLDYVAGQSGTSIESLIGAVQNLQVRLGDDNSGAAAAFAKLGINADAFNKLGTYEQMTSLSDAIKGIQDPTEQASVSAALFGKTWKEILPAIKSGLKETGDQATVMADDVVKASDRIGDALKAGKQIAIVWGASLITAFEKSAFAVGDFLSEFDPAHFGLTNTQVLKLAAAVNDPNGLYGALSKIPPAAKGATDGLKSVALSAADAAGVAKDLTREGEESIKMHEAAAKAAKKHAAAEEKFKNSVESISFKTFIQDTSKLNAIIPDLSGHMADMAAAFADARDHADDLASSSLELERVESSTGAILGGTVIPMFSKLPNVVAQSTKAIEDAGKTIETSLGDKASAALGGIVKILHLGNTAFGDFAATAAQGAASIINSWKNTHSVVDVVINSIATAATLISKLFNDPEKQINPVREAFVQLNGGLAGLNEKAHEAGVTLNALLNAKNPEAYKAAIDALNDAFKFQDDAMKTLNDTVQKYGFSISELGPAFAAQKLSEQAGTLLQDYQVLTAAGVDHVAIIEKMGPALNEYVKQSILAGNAIPEQMRPVLQSMVDLGDLTDENGDKLTDLTRLTFSETLDKKFSSLIDTINKLTDAISRGLTSAINNIPAPAPVHIPVTYDDPGRPGGEVHVQIVYDDPGRGADYAASGGLVTTGGVQYLAGGGIVSGIQYLGSGGKVRRFGSERAVSLANEERIV